LGEILFAGSWKRLPVVLKARDSFPAVPPFPGGGARELALALLASLPQDLGGEANRGRRDPDHGLDRVKEVVRSGRRRDGDKASPWSAGDEGGALLLIPIAPCHFLHILIEIASMLRARAAEKLAARRRKLKGVGAAIRGRRVVEDGAVRRLLEDGLAGSKCTGCYQVTTPASTRTAALSSAR